MLHITPLSTFHNLTAHFKKDDPVVASSTALESEADRSDRMVNNLALKMMFLNEGFANQLETGRVEVVAEHKQLQQSFDAAYNLGALSSSEILAKHQERLFDAQLAQTVGVRFTPVLDVQLTPALGVRFSPDVESHAETIAHEKQEKATAAVSAYAASENQANQFIQSYTSGKTRFSSEATIQAQIAEIFSKSTVLGNDMVKESLELNRQRNGDLANMRNMMAQLRALTAGQKEDAELDIGGIIPDLDPDSPLGAEAADAMKRYEKAINDPAFLDWAESRGLDVSTINISDFGENKDCLYGKWNGSWGYHSIAGSPWWRENGGEIRDAANGLDAYSLSAVLAHYGVTPANPETVAEALATIESLKGKADNLSANSQTDMLGLQQQVSKLNEKYSQWSSLYEKIAQSMQGLIR